MKHILLALLLIAACASSAQADRRDHDLAQEAVRSGEALPLREILSRIRPQIAGEVIHVELEREDGRLVYEFRVLGTNGRLRKFHVNAADASILDREDR